MNNGLKRIMVALDMSPHDSVLIRFAAVASSNMGIDKVYFIHVTESLDFGDEILESYPDLLVPMDESIRHNIEFELERASFPNDVPREILVEEGQPAKVITRLAGRKDSDLLILGRKSDKIANINLVRKLVRLSPCSLAIVPETVPDRIKRIVVPTDFSEHSKKTIEEAIALGDKLTDLELLVFHAYEVPAGYTRIGKTFEEFADVMEINATKKMGYFLKDIVDSPVKIVQFVKRIERKTLPHMINQFAAVNYADAIMIGSRGRDSLSAFILGSVTEALIEHDQYLPLFISKDKRDHLSFIEAIGEL